MSTTKRRRRTNRTVATGVTEPRPNQAKRGEPILFEIAWEVCNQVGGIYTVLRSKAPMMVDNWGNRYCLVGPYSGESASIEFEETPATGDLGQALELLREQGIGAHFGRWLVTGRPHVVLLDFLDVFDRLHEIKYRLWEEHGIAAPADDPLINNAVAFGEACRQFLTLLAQGLGSQQRIIAHFHEWLAAVAIPQLRQENWPGTTVFTTHATLLGRYLAMNDADFYEHLPSFDADGEAARYNSETPFRIERAAAHGAHVFTTVSDVTGRECEHLLGRAPDMLLPNGFNIQRFAAIHEFQNLHRQYKERIHRFTMGHFFGSYSFNLDKTLYFFTAGRFEYRNKGMDLTIEALARLNHRLRETNSDVTVVAFIITRRPFRSINPAVLEQRAMLREFRTICDAVKDQLGDRLFESAAAGQIPDFNKLADEYWLLRLRRTIHTWKREQPPTIITHDLLDDEHDEVLNQLRSCQLWNLEDDPVKVIYHPDFITSTNPLFGMEYDQFVRGCNLGIFPSYYEPWGYTPMEAIALGVPAITSDLSGFGSYLIQLLPDHEQKGLYVINRHHVDWRKAADQLADRLFVFSALTRRERVDLRNRVESFSEHFDWHNLGRRYLEAHELALDRME